MDFDVYKRADELQRKIKRLRDMQGRIEEILGQHADVHYLHAYNEPQELEILQILNGVCNYRIAEEIKILREQFEEL